MVRRSTGLRQCGLETTLTAILPERDPLPQPDTAARADYLRRTAPQVECRTVPDAGHWVAFEAPDAVNGLLVDFAGRHAPGVARGPAVTS